MYPSNYSALFLETVLLHIIVRIESICKMPYYRKVSWPILLYSWCRLHGDWCTYSNYIGSAKKLWEVWQTFVKRTVYLFGASMCIVKQVLMNFYSYVSFFGVSSDYQNDMSDLGIYTFHNFSKLSVLTASFVWSILSFTWDINSIWTEKT